MTFLAPAALAFTALLTVPIAVHIFKPRRVRQTPFSSLRWLTLSPQKLSRRIRPHQLLLFALRAGFVLLLVLALTRPLITTGDAAPVANRVIVLDVSRSMGASVPGRPSPMVRAREQAIRFVESASPGTHTTVIVADSSARPLNATDREAATILPELRQIESTFADTNLAAALPIAKPLLMRGGELIFITDNQLGAWDADAMTAFAAESPAGLRVRVIDVGAGVSANGWIASARLVEAGEPARRLLRIELAASGESQDRTVRVTGVAGMEQAVRSVALEPGRPTNLHLELPADAPPSGQAVRITLEPPDALPDDDEYFLCLDPRASLRVLLVEPEATGPEATRPGFPLRTAIDALNTAGTRSARLTRRTPATTTAAEIHAADVILLADVPDLPESIVEPLRERILAGAGLGVFLGHRARAVWFNDHLYRPLQPSEGLLPVEVGSVVDGPTALPWVLPARPHPLLAGFGDPIVGDLAGVSSTRHRQLETTPASAARLPDRTPLIVEHHAGSGTVLLVNASPDDTFSDLPRRKCFVPFVDRMLSSLGKGRGREFTSGQPMRLPLAGLRPGESVTLIGPAGERRSILARQEATGAVLDLDGVDRPGVYRVEGGATNVFAVNAGRGDCILDATDPAMLRSWWQPLECTVEAATESNSEETSRGPFALWPVLICLGAAVLVTETVAAAWFCPRLTPVATTSLIQQQRLSARRD